MLNFPDVPSLGECEFVEVPLPNNRMHGNLRTRMDDEQPEFWNQKKNGCKCEALAYCHQNPWQWSGHPQQNQHESQTWSFGRCFFFGGE